MSVSVSTLLIGATVLITGAVDVVATVLSLSWSRRCAKRRALFKCHNAKIAINRHLLPTDDPLRSIAGAHHRRNVILAGND